MKSKPAKATLDIIYTERSVRQMCFERGLDQLVAYGRGTVCGRPATIWRNYRRGEFKVTVWRPGRRVLVSVKRQFQIISGPDRLCAVHVLNEAADKLRAMEIAS